MTDEPSSSLQIVTTHLSKALDLLDAAQAPGDTGAYVDLALQRVRQTLCLPNVAVESGTVPLIPKTTKLFLETTEACSRA